MTIKSLRRGKEEFKPIEFTLNKRCSWCSAKEIQTYDVIGLMMCADCISRIRRLNPKTGDIQVKEKVTDHA